MNLQPITDPKRMVTDANVLTQLAAEGIDKDYVEFSDYSRERPYSKLYTDLKSDRRILVSSGLPMCRKTDGTLLTPGFEDMGGVYWLRNNLFDGYATRDGEFHLAAVNDQPTGPIAGDESHFAPVLHVGGEIVSPRGVTLLETDPTNANYHDNVIEWDYGICKRRIRVIEGRFRGTWAFPGNPGGDIRIEYNRTGRANLRLGTARDADGKMFEIEVPSPDVEFVSESVWAGRTGGITVGDSATFYPDADPESVSTDNSGYVYVCSPYFYQWGTLKYLTDPWWSVNGFLTDSIVVGMSAVGQGSTDYKYYYYDSAYRGIFLFGTPISGIVTAATLSIYGNGYINDIPYTPSAVGVFSSNPASNIHLVKSDFYYTRMGTTPFGNSILFTNWANSYNDFVFNSDGLSAIVNGVSKFSLRDSAYDAGGSTPNQNNFNRYTNYIYCYFSEKGAGYKPKLTVTYTPYDPRPAQSYYYSRRRRS